MKITKGHYVPKELITSEAVHEAVVKAFVAAGFERLGICGYGTDIGVGVIGVGARHDGGIMKNPLTLQQLFTAENGLQWPDWAEHVQCGDDGVFFTSENKGVIQFISGSFYQAESAVLAIRQLTEKSPLGQYEWGKEYPTNGKRPDLPDDVLVAYQHETMGGLCFDSDRVEDVGWLSVVSFKVTDTRYKPVDTSYLNTPTKTQSLTHSEWYNYEEKRPHVAGILPPIGSEVIYKVWNKDTVSDENAKRDGCILDVVAHHDGLIVGVSKDLYFSTCLSLIHI